MTKLEQIEKLREKANVTYDEARAALEAADGDLLDAIIGLEKQGKVNPPNAGGYYTSSNVEGSADNGFPESEEPETNRETFSDAIDRFGKFCVKIINKGNTSSFEVLKSTESKAKFPLTVLVLLLIFAPYITIPLIIVGWILGYRYRFNGIDLGEA